MRGHVRRRGARSWAVVVDLGRDASGKRKQKWHTVRGTRRDADRELARILRELDTGTYTEPSKMTVGGYLERWLGTYAAPNVAPKTLERYAEIIHAHLIPAFGHVSLQGLQPLHIQEYYSEALRSGRRDGKGGLSARTVLHHHRVLRESLRQAVKWQLAVRNVADAVEPPRPTRKEMHVLSNEQTARLIHETTSTRFRIPVLLAVTTGMRRGEILALRWQDVDFANQTLAVRQSLEQTKSGLDFKQPKTSKSRRTISMPTLLSAALRRHRADQAKIRLLLGPSFNERGLVCTKADGKPIVPSELTRAFSRLVKTVCAPNKSIRFHDLRHGHATQLLREGVHPKVVSERLGHSTISITMDVYSHVLPGMQEEAARKLDVALRASLKSRSKQRDS
jgi:integrase